VTGRDRGLGIGGQGATSRSRQRGVALIIVLGLVALIGAWASTAAYEDMVALRRAENMQDAMRAMQASQSAFALGRQVLRQDARDNAQRDDMDEAWAMETPPFPVDEGMVLARISDANRYYNLNDLVNDQGVVQAREIAIVKRLFTLLEIDSGLVDALADWMDADDSPYGSAGAEDIAYYERQYRVKNARLDRWDELRLIKGFDAKVITKLANVATVRQPPTGTSTKININTAPAPVLMALFRQMTDVDAETIISARPYDSPSIATMNQPWAGSGDMSRLSVTSDAFMVRTEARFGRAVMQEEYVLRRQLEKLTLLSRERLLTGLP